MYKEVGIISKEVIDRLENQLKKANWKDIIGDNRDYKTWVTQVEGFDAVMSFYLLIPPGGKVHKHTDTKRNEKTYHIPIKTNDKCISYSGGKPYHLEVGKIYEIDRQIEHWSINEGETDRIHLLIEK